MKLKVKTPFKWAHQGVRVEEFAAGQVIETEDADLIEVSQHEGWTVRPRNRPSKPDGTPQTDGDDQDDDGPDTPAGEADGASPAAADQTTPAAE